MVMVGVCVCSDSSVNTSDVVLIKDDTEVCRMWGSSHYPATLHHTGQYATVLLLSSGLLAALSHGPVETSDCSSCMAPGPVPPFLPIPAVEPLLTLMV